MWATCEMKDKLKTCDWWPVIDLLRAIPQISFERETHREITTHQAALLCGSRATSSFFAESLLVVVSFARSLSNCVNFRVYTRNRVSAEKSVCLLMMRKKRWTAAVGWWSRLISCSKKQRANWPVAVDEIANHHRNFNLIHATQITLSRVDKIRSAKNEEEEPATLVEWRKQTKSQF